MLKHAYLIFVATFLLGVVSGVVLYIASHSGQEGGSDIHESSGFTIAAYAYGSCERTSCPSYRIAQDGAYAFVAAGGTRFEGSIPFSDRAALGAALRDTPLGDLEETIFVGTCPITYDGPAYRYDIFYNGMNYHFDSCGQELGATSLFHALEDYFATFAERHGV